MPLNPVGALRQPPRFEFIVSPSKDFLRWLVTNTETWPSNWSKAKMPKSVLDARKLLIKGEPKRSEALATIEVAGATPDRIQVGGVWKARPTSIARCLPNVR